MNPETSNLARLLLPDGAESLIRGTLSIGRTPGNDVILPQEKVSRRHALIHSQEHGRFCFVDLGSSNGSYVNGKRVVQPVILKDGDQIDVGSTRLVFSDPNDRRDPELAENERTLQDIRAIQLWLLVADINDSTRMTQQSPGAEAPSITGRWLAECKKQIESHGGAINKFLGDGFLAYWPGDAPAGRIADALRALREMQRAKLPSFRVVLHRGQAFVGGAGSLGEENLAGRDLNFVFRMEKLAGALKSGILLSTEARTSLENDFAWVENGRHSLSGFDGDFLFHTVKDGDRETVACEQGAK